MTPNPLIVHSAAMTDPGYRSMVRTRNMPDRIHCPQCELAAIFQDDDLAARYECENGHVIAAMWVDPVVVGRDRVRT